MSADRAKVIFMGTGPFAAEILRALLREKERFRPVAVFTKASSPAGRGRRRVFSDPVRAAAAENDLPLFSPTGSLRENSVQEQMAGFSPTVAVVASYGKILPPEILSLPERGCVNVHASLLPRWRGASPIQHAIAAGDQKTGVTIMKMDARIDTGAIIAQKELEIGPDETAPELSVRLAELGGRLLTEVLPWYLCGEISPRPQDPSAATVCGKITRRDGLVNWRKSAPEIYNLFRAFVPWPGVFSRYRLREREKKIKFLDLRPGDDRPSLPPGTVFWDEAAAAAAVAAGRGSIILRKVQKEGGRVLDCREFLNGEKDFLGVKLY